MWEINCSIEKLVEYLGDQDLQKRIINRIAFLQMVDAALTRNTEEMLVSENELWRFLGRLKQKEQLQIFRNKLNDNSDGLT